MRYQYDRSARRHDSRRCAIEALESRQLLSTVPPQVVDIEVASTSWAPEFVDFVQDSNPASRGYSIPFGSAQLNSLTWTNIDQIILRFSEDVYIDAADLSLSGVNTTAYQFSDFHYDPIDHAAIWTLTAPLDKDRLHLDLDANGIDPVRDLDGNILDGEWVNKVSTISGNGTAGGDFQFTFHVQPTDVDNNGRITTNDYTLIYQLNGKTIADSQYKAARDIDGNGIINSLDWQEAIDRYLEQRPSGNPAGVGNDAPTTAGFDLVEITDTEMDVAISLVDQFDDAESGASGLTYMLLSYSNGSLFDSISINQTTQQLVVNAAANATGRSEVVVRATDSVGLTVDTVVTIDVNYENQPPEIWDLWITCVDYNTWVVTGRVVDPDDDVSDFIVYFSGVFTIRSAVDEEGYFLFAVYLDEGQAGVEEVVTVDPHGLYSEIYYRDVGDFT
jgi:hypothetical protein